MRWITILLICLAPICVAAEAPSTVVGKLIVTSIDSKILNQPRTVRVWLPPNYDADPQARFDVLYLHDGQNCFDVKTSAFGKEWQIDETLTRLIDAKAVPPLVVVAIDNGGADRLSEMTFDADPKHGGGGAEQYADFILEEVLPWAQAHFRLHTGPQHTLLGGSSLGGLVSLEIVRRHPGIFGGVMALSPSLWWNNQSPLHAIEKDPGGLADAHVVLSIGTRENFKSADDEENKQTVEQMRTFFNTLSGKQHQPLRWEEGAMSLLIVSPDAVHDENAWAKVFPDAIICLRKQRPTTQP